MKLAAFAAAAALMWTASASADLITFDLTSGNTAIGGYTGDYAVVTVNRTSATEATITFQSLCTGDVLVQSCSAGDEIFLFGDGGSVAVNVNATSFTLGTISGSNSGTGFSAGPYSDGGAGNENGFGSFNQTINSFDGYTNTSDLITFSITNTSGTWANAGEVLTLNSNDSLAAAHIFVAAWPANQEAGALATGFAAGSNDSTLPPQETPEPGVLALLGVALLGFASTGRRRGS